MYTHKTAGKDLCLVLPLKYIEDMGTLRQRKVKQLKLKRQENLPSLLQKEVLGINNHFAHLYKATPEIYQYDLELGIIFNWGNGLKLSSTSTFSQECD